MSMIRLSRCTYRYSLPSRGAADLETSGGGARILACLSPERRCAALGSEKSNLRVSKDSDIPTPCLSWKTNSSRRVQKADQWRSIGPSRPPNAVDSRRHKCPPHALTQAPDEPEPLQVLLSYQRSQSSSAFGFQTRCVSPSSLSHCSWREFCLSTIVAAS